MRNGTNWRMEPQQAENRTKLYIYDDIEKYGSFNWETWDYDDSETSAKYFQKKLDEIPDGQEIELHINSNGGSVSEAVTIYNLLKQKENQKVGIVDGVAHSAAFLILQACDVRKMCVGTSALIHNMWMRCYGNAKQLRKYADDLDAMMESNRQVFLERATITEEKLTELMENETYLTPDTALEYGLIDEIHMKRKVEPEPEKLMERLQQMQKMLNEQQSFREQLEKMRKTEKKQETLLGIFKGVAQKGGKE